MCVCLCARAYLFRHLLLRIDFSPARLGMGRKIEPLFSAHLHTGKLGGVFVITNFDSSISGSCVRCYAFLSAVGVKIVAILLDHSCPPSFFFGVNFRVGRF